MRQTKTPAARAQEALDRAERRVKRLAENVDRLKTEYEQASADLAAARTRRDYLGQDPDLVAAAWRDGDETPGVLAP